MIWTGNDVAIVISALIVTIPQVIGVIQNIFIKRKVNETKDAVNIVGADVNGRLTELVDTTREAATAVGNAAGVLEERNRQFMEK